MSSDPREPGPIGLVRNTDTCISNEFTVEADATGLGSLISTH